MFWKIMLKFKYSIGMIRLCFIMGFLFVSIRMSYAAPVVTPSGDFIPGEMLLKLKDNLTPGQIISFYARLNAKLKLKKVLTKRNLHKIEVSEVDTQSPNKKRPASKKTLEDLVQDLRGEDEVEYAELNYVFGIDPQLSSTNEILTQTQVDSYTQGLSMGGSASYDQSLAPVGVEASWSMEKTLQENAHRPIVAVIDTGIDLAHAALLQTESIWANGREIPGNGIDDDNNGFIDDVNGWNFFANSNNPQDDENHGTHVAGIILGVGQDLFPSQGQVLEKSKIQLMALKFLDSTGRGSTSDAIEAIYYAVDNGAQIINNSWGGGSSSQALHDALKYAYDQHVFIASAAGNSAVNNDVTPIYPGNYPVPSSVSIAATNDSDVLASFSNYGATSVSLASPGVSILSFAKGSSYKFMSGTSMATPFVAGLAAMVLRENENLTGYQLKNILLASATPVNGLGGKVSSGARISALNAISYVRNMGQGGDSNQPMYSAQSSDSMSSSSNSSFSTGCGRVGTHSDDFDRKMRFYGVFALIFPLVMNRFLRSRLSLRQ